MSWLGESLKQFLSREAGQKRTKRLNEGISEALRYYLGPTGVPERMEAAAMLNPVQDMYEAGADMKAGDYGSAAVNTASALMPTIGAKLAGGGAVDDVANVISDTLTSVGTKATGAMDAGQAFAVDEFGGVGPSKGIRAYHGSPHDFDSFDDNDFYWFSNDKGYAEGLAGRSNLSNRGNGTVFEAKINIKNPLEIDVPSEAAKAASDAGLPVDEMSPEEIERAFLGGENFEFLVNQYEPTVKSGKHDGIIFRDTYDGFGKPTDQYVIFDENLIEIVRKYGIAGAAALLGVSASDVQAAMGQQE